jgi:hypothetical protein
MQAVTPQQLARLSPAQVAALSAGALAGASPALLESPQFSVPRRYKQQWKCLRVDFTIRSD